MHVLACVKWVALRPEVDPLTGEVDTDVRFSGASPADLSALEWALRIAADRQGSVTVATVAGPEADAMLRHGLAAGADRAVRIDESRPLSSRAVAAQLAAASSDADLVCCGDHSLDRGTGAVPVFLAHLLQWPQALGLVSLRARDREPAEAGAPTDESGPPAWRLSAERRLDQGRRERLDVTGPAVLSFERGPELRRAALSATLASDSASIEVVEPIEVTEPTTPRLVASGPFRPPANVKPPPVGGTDDRIAALVGSGNPGGGSQAHDLPPREAAELVVEHLVEWGYLDPPEEE